MIALPGFGSTSTAGPGICFFSSSFGDSVGTVRRKRDALGVVTLQKTVKDWRICGDDSRNQWTVSLAKEDMLLGRCAPLFSLVARTRNPLCAAGRDGCGGFLICRCIQTLVIAGATDSYFSKCLSTRISTSAMVDSSQSVEGLGSNYKLSRKARKRTPMQNLEVVFKFELDNCCKDGKFVEGLQLYDEAKKNGIKLTQYHYNALLYLCSMAGSGSHEEGSEENLESLKLLAKRRGFDIFQDMASDKIVPNEATFTNAARLAATIEDPEMAFDLVKEMKNNGIPPRLRSYGPSLFGFCKIQNADKAYDVDEHMVDSGVLAEESELAALLEVSVVAKRAEKVYEFLHRLRASVRQVSPSSAQIVEDWFNSVSATIVGSDCWDVVKIKESIARVGGGWHGQGWLGSGKWNVARTQMDAEGVCQSCGEKLACIDIDPKETENFASSLTELAFKREVKATFVRFQEWLQQHGPFDAVIDGANVGLIKGHFFNFFQLNCAVNELREMSPSKRYPLVVLHQTRVHTGPALEPRNKKLLERWRKAGALFEAPVGSNDDWYWLYAAVSSNCLIVTNDEMRDHLFQLLGTSFFPRWKEKHQVRLSASPRGLELHMPPPYSVVIQESKDGSWHVPIATGDDLEARRQWICAARHSKT
ncbi:hypothetical protein MLD38_035732 [Melastoma candidum]|uniref:Uncharacterized protein n=1 Tax=Melastoma candidum TaxID=119954 RepID=A0ACB9LIQ0_9MYRT|nr:hypothetical protein MLD38_035732 [Melastoma candidum]